MIQTPVITEWVVEIRDELCGNGTKPLVVIQGIASDRIIEWQLNRQEAEDLTSALLDSEL